MNWRETLKISKKNVNPKSIGQKNKFQKLKNIEVIFLSIFFKMHR